MNEKVTCNIDKCKNKAIGSWLDQDRLILTYACRKHFIKYHLQSALEVDKVIKPEILPFRRRL